MNCKMARPHLTLDKWLSTDTDLKKDFLDQESYMKESLLTKLDKPGQKIVYISTNHPQPRSHENLISDSLQNLARTSHINEIFTNPLICVTTNFIIKANGRSQKAIGNGERKDRESQKGKRSQRQEI